MHQIATRQRVQILNYLYLCLETFVVSQIKAFKSCQAIKQDGASEAYSPAVEYQTILDSKTSKDKVRRYIKFSYSSIQITSLRELEDLLLTESVWLAEQAIAWPFWCSFLKQRGLLGEVSLGSTCSPLRSWFTAHKKSFSQAAYLTNVLLQGMHSCLQSEKV